MELDNEDALRAASALSRLVKERDEATELKNHARKCCDEAEASVASLTALLAEADEVVNPFAEVAADFDADGRVMEDTCPIYANTAGDFRAARRYQQKREAKP